MKKTIIAFFLGCIILNTSCNTESAHIDESKAILSSANEMYIPFDQSTITLKDINKIINLRNKEYITKGVSKVVKNIIPINDESNTPAYFITNFIDNTALIVSASKNYTPILGVIEDGNIDLNNLKALNHPLLSYLEEYKEDIYLAKRNKSDTLKLRYASEWSIYEPREIIKTKASSEREQQIQNWTAKGYECHNLNMVNYFLGPEEGSKFIRDIVSQTPPGIDPMVESILLVKRDNFIYGPLLNTTWGQGAPLNYGASNGYAGCVTVAVAQIMNFHKWPTTYNWSSIGNYPSYSNQEAQRLGINLRSQLNSKYEEDGTSSNIEYAASALTENKFTAILSNFNPYDLTQVVNIGSEIIDRRPVYMRGQNSESGHAWVCSGYKYGNTLYAALYITREFGDYGSYAYYTGVNKPTDKFFYMDWGWNGYGNGWIYSSSATPSTSAPSSFDKYRQILKIKPNK